MALDGRQQVRETHLFSYCAWKCLGLWYKVAYHNIGGTNYQSVLLHDHLHSKVLPHVLVELPVLQFLPVASCSTAWQH